MLDFKSQFVEMFGNPVLNERQWKIELFGNLGNFKNGMNFNKSDNGYKIRFLGVGDFNKGSIIHNIETLEIIDLKEKPSKEYMLEDKDIIFAKPNVGESGKGIEKFKVGKIIKLSPKAKSAAIWKLKGVNPSSLTKEVRYVFKNYTRKQIGNVVREASKWLRYSIQSSFVSSILSSF